MNRPSANLVEKTLKEKEMLSQLEEVMRIFENN